MSSTDTESSPRSATSRSAASCKARRVASFLRSRSPDLMAAIVRSTCTQCKFAECARRVVRTTDPPCCRDGAPDGDPAAGPTGREAHLHAGCVGDPARALPGGGPLGRRPAGGPGCRAARRLRRHRPARPASRAPGEGAESASDPERRGQLLSERRLRGLLRAGRLRPGLRPRVRPGGGRDVARPGARHRSRDQPRGPGLRGGEEHYVAEGNEESVLLRGSAIGLLGFGNLGRALHRLLRPFDAHIRVHDPWLPDAVLRQAGVHPAGLDETISESRFLFVLATVTAETEHLLGARELDLMPHGARLVLVSRAAVADFGALRKRIEEGSLLAAVDVWPEEPVPADSPFRTLDGLVFSGHRAGGIPQAFLEVGEMVLDDLWQIQHGLPPARMQVAARELVGRYRNRPVT